ncbi:MAG: ABC transporter, permease protein 1 (cluster 5, nickel/peptides/opines), partial [uncultured Microvirga sp.]
RRGGGGRGTEGAGGTVCPAPPTPLGLRPSRPSPQGGGHSARHPRPENRLHHPDPPRGVARVLCPGAHRPGRPARLRAAARRLGRSPKNADRALRLRPLLPRTVRHLAVAGAARRPRHLHRLRPLGHHGSSPRRRQHAAARRAGDAHRVLLRQSLRLRRRLLPGLVGRQARLRPVRARGQRAALLARHGAGHHLRRRARLAAADRRGSRRLGRLGLGLGACAPHDPAGAHHVGDPHGHHRPHRAGAGRRHPAAGVRHRPARQGPHRSRRLRPCGQERRPDRARGHGAAARVSARRVDPDRDRFLLAGHRLPAQRGDLPARSALAAGHHPGARPLLRAAQPPGRCGAIHPRPAHPAGL